MPLRSALVQLSHINCRQFAPCVCCCCCLQASDQYLLDGLKRLCEAALAEVS